MIFTNEESKKIAISFSFFPITSSDTTLRTPKHHRAPSSSFFTAVRLIHCATASFWLREAGDTINICLRLEFYGAHSNTIIYMDATLL